MSKNDDFGSYLRKLREARGISVNELARQVGISGAEMSRVERGVRQKINPYLLRKISPLLGVDILQLMRRAGFLPSTTPMLRTRGADAHKDRLEDLITKAVRLDATDLERLEILVDSMLASTLPDDTGEEV